jgi:hypothetical protein
VQAGHRGLAVLGVLGLSILACAGGWALLESFHIQPGSSWRWAPNAGSLVVLGAGLTLVFARARAPWWEVGLAVVLSLLVAVMADAFITVVHIFI